MAIRQKENLMQGWLKVLTELFYVFFHVSVNFKQLHVMPISTEPPTSAKCLHNQCFLRVLLMAAVGMTVTQDTTVDLFLMPSGHLCGTRNDSPGKSWWWWINLWVTEVVRAKFSHPHCPVKEWHYDVHLWTTGGALSLGVIWARPWGDTEKSDKLDVFFF